MDAIDRNGYRSLADDLRSLYAKASERGAELEVYAILPATARLVRNRESYPRLGSVTEFEFGKSRTRLEFLHMAHRRFQPELVALLAKCGALLPNRVRGSLSKGKATTAAAWWMLALWEHSKIQPELITDFLGSEDDCGELFAGWCWDDPIGASLSAIESMGHAAPNREETTILIGEWSVPMSKTEFARRILHKSDARARDVDAIFEGFEKRQVAPNTWTFRLDTLPPETRKKLEGGKR